MPVFDDALTIEENAAAFGFRAEPTRHGHLEVFESDGKSLMLLGLKGAEAWLRAGAPVTPELPAWMSGEAWAGGPKWEPVRGRRGATLTFPDGAKLLAVKRWSDSEWDVTFVPAHMEVDEGECLYDGSEDEEAEFHALGCITDWRDWATHQAREGV